MVNLFSSTPCTISGGSCMCGSFTDGFVEPFANTFNIEFYPEEEGNYEEGNADTFYNQGQVQTTQQTGAFDPIESLFSQFFDSPAKQQQSVANVPIQQHQAVANPIIHSLSSRLGVSPSTLQRPF